MKRPWIHIIGAGVSGLTLGAELARAGELPGDVIISDPRLDQPQSKTFCFWFNERSKPLLQPEKIWSSWSFSSARGDGEHLITHHGKHWRYGLVSGAGFRERTLSEIRPHPQIHLSQEMISAPPNADYVFDSRPPKFDNYRVKQSFVGLEVKLESPHELTSVELMHDLRFIEGGVQFRYVLPLDERRLLVEYTRFTTRDTALSDLETLGRVWLEQTWGDFSVERVERAHIPMGLKRTPECWGIPMGTRASMTRDSTGYGFAEIHAWSAQTARDLLARRTPTLYRSPKFRAWMDSCLLRLIEERPELLPEIFMQLSDHMPPHHFAGFMTRCTLSDAIMMMLKAPKRSFLLSALGQPQWI